MKKTKKDKIKRFDFAKKPTNPCFLMTAAKLIISWPDLKKRNLKLEKRNMEQIEGKPYLLLVTHSSMVVGVSKKEPCMALDWAQTMLPGSKGSAIQ